MHDARPCAGRLLHGFDQLDIALEQLVDELSNLDAFGLGTFGDPVADLGVEVDRQVEHGAFAVEQAAFALAEIVFVSHGVGALARVVSGIGTADVRGR